MRRPESRLARVALLGVGYLLLARAALLLAIPPGYSTAVWPAAGLAFGLLWTWGPDAWPGLLLGAFLANVWMTWDRGFLSPASAGLSAWIAAGATLQGLAAVVLARRAASGRDPLRTEGGLAAFLFWGGLAACLVSATWATMGMLKAGVIAPGETLFSWATWWSGDAIGVLTIAPLIPLWLAPDGRGRDRVRLALTAAMAATLVAIASVQDFAIASEVRLARAQAAQKLADVSLTLRVGMGGHVDALQAAADFFHSSQDVTRQEFARFAHGMIERHPGVQAVEWRPRVPDSRRAAVEAAARRDGLKDFQFVGMEKDGRLKRRGKAPEYYPILYAEPLAGNEKALGLDINRQQPEVLEAAERAVTTGKPAASGGFHLVQETGTQTSVAVLVPVRDYPEERITGLLEGVFRVGDLMESLLAGTHTEALSVRVIDVTNPADPRGLYARGNPSPDSLEAVTMTGDFAGRVWRISLVPDAGFQQRERSPLSWYALATMTLVTALLCWVLFSLYGRASA